MSLHSATLRKVALLPLFSFFFFFLLPASEAHCPLCTITAAAAAGGAMWLGVNEAAIGVFIGAFAVALGLWIARKIKQRIPFQKSLLTAGSYFATVLPMLPLMKGFVPWYLSLAGTYGSLLNRTYLINLFLIGSIIGAVLTLLGPVASKGITHLRNNKTFPFQGMGITFFLLLFSAVLLQVLL